MILINQSGNSLRNLPEAETCKNFFLPGRDSVIAEIADRALVGVFQFSMILKGALPDGIGGNQNTVS